MMSSDNSLQLPSLPLLAEAQDDLQAAGRRIRLLLLLLLLPLRAEDVVGPGVMPQLFLLNLLHLPPGPVGGHVRTRQLVPTALPFLLFQNVRQCQNKRQGSSL